MPSPDAYPNTAFSEHSPTFVKPPHLEETPVHEEIEKAVTVINLAGKNGLHAQIHLSTHEGSKLAEFIRELLT